MDTYSLLRQFADSWFLLAMMAFFLGCVLWALRPGSRALHEDAADVVFRGSEPAGGVGPSGGGASSGGPAVAGLPRRTSAWSRATSGGGGVGRSDPTPTPEDGGAPCARACPGCPCGRGADALEALR